MEDNIIPSYSPNSTHWRDSIVKFRAAMNRCTDFVLSQDIPTNYKIGILISEGYIEVYHKDDKGFNKDLFRTKI